MRFLDARALPHGTSFTAPFRRFLSHQDLAELENLGNRPLGENFSNDVPVNLGKRRFHQAPRLQPGGLEGRNFSYGKIQP